MQKSCMRKILDLKIRIVKNTQRSCAALSPEEYELIMFEIREDFEEIRRLKELDAMILTLTTWKDRARTIPQYDFLERKLQKLHDRI